MRAPLASSAPGRGLRGGGLEPSGRDRLAAHLAALPTAGRTDGSASVADVQAALDAAAAGWDRVGTARHGRTVGRLYRRPGQWLVLAVDDAVEMTEMLDRFRELTSPTAHGSTAVLREVHARQATNCAANLLRRVRACRSGSADDILRAVAAVPSEPARSGLAGLLLATLPAGEAASQRLLIGLGGYAPLTVA